MRHGQAQTGANSGAHGTSVEQAAGFADTPPRRADGAGAVRHAIEVLRVISDAGEPIGINEIARRVGLNKSTVSRIVATLAQERLVARERATGQIALGIGLVVLAAPVLAMLDAKDIARPHLQELARRSGETVSFSIWDGEQAVSVEQALGASAVRTYAAPGRRNAGHCTAAGKMLLAHAGEEAISAALARRLIAHTDRTITDPARLRGELDEAVRRGYALNEFELELDVGAVAAPVTDRHGEVVGAITATVPAYRFGKTRRRELIEMVKDAARIVSAELGAMAA